MEEAKSVDLDDKPVHFEHKECPYYPCHRMGTLNCIFCWCPLYSYADCGGKFKFTDKGIKDCSDCTLPHRRKGWKYVTDFLKAHKDQFEYRVKLPLEHTEEELDFLRLSAHCLAKCNDAIELEEGKNP